MTIDLPSIGYRWGIYMYQLSETKIMHDMSMRCATRNVSRIRLYGIPRKYDNILFIGYMSCLVTWRDVHS